MVDDNKWYRNVVTDEFRDLGYSYDKLFGVCYPGRDPVQCLRGVRCQSSYSDRVYFVLGLAVAVSDEYIQLHAPGRSALVTDVILDFSGVFFIWLTREVWSWAKR